MKFSADSAWGLVLGALLLASPAWAAPAKKPVRHAKPAAPVVEPQPDPALLIARARDAQSRGETELALRLAQAAIVADPARPSAYDTLADIYAASTDPDAARVYYQEALSVDPTDAAAQKAVAALDHGSNQRAARADSSGPQTGTP